MLYEGLNEYTLNYEKTIDNRKKADVIVKHHYETIGVDKNTVEDVSEDPVQGYVGENFTTEAVIKDGFTPKGENSKTLKVKDGDSVIDFYYEKDARIPATITVNHHYSITRYELVTTIENGAEVTRPEWVTTGSGIVAVDVEGDYYVGSKFTPVEITNPDIENDNYNYTYESGSTGEQILKSISNIYDIYYNIELEDELEDASLKINHIYETWKTYVDESGNIVRDEIIEDYSSYKTITGKSGQTVIVEIKENGDYKRYDANGLSLKLNGTFSEITLKYRQYINDLGDKVSIEVQPYYVTYTKSIDENGETIITKTGEEKAESVIYQELYAGQYFNVVY